MLPMCFGLAILLLYSPTFHNNILMYIIILAMISGFFSNIFDRQKFVISSHIICFVSLLTSLIIRFVSLNYDFYYLFYSLFIGIVFILLIPIALAIKRYPDDIEIREKQ